MKDIKKLMISGEAKRASNVILTLEFLKKLRIAALIESVGASTRMAGSKLSNKEVEKLISER